MTYTQQKADITVGAVIRARKELECMNEAMCEMEKDGTSHERRQVIWQELAARVWAGIYALQYMDKAEKPDGYDEVMLSADAFDCTGTSEQHMESGLFDDAEVH